MMHLGYEQLQLVFAKLACTYWGSACMVTHLSLSVRILYVQCAFGDRLQFSIACVENVFVDLVLDYLFLKLALPCLCRRVQLWTGEVAANMPPADQLKVGQW